MLCVPEEWTLIKSEGTAVGLENLRTSNNVEEDTKINRGRRGEDLMGR